MPKSQDPKEKIVDSILAILKDKKIKIDGEEIYKRIEAPPSPEMGDFAFPAFFWLPGLRCSPTKLLWN